MAKYSLKEREGLAAAGRRLGIGRNDKNVSQLRKGSAQPVAKAAAKKRPVHRRESESERMEGMIEKYQLKHLVKTADVPAYDVTNPTRYPEAAISSKTGQQMLEKILHQYAYVMKPQGITPTEFKRWREQFMYMNPEQLGALVRVSGRTIRNWESGETPIPFSMWWVMHVTMQDPEYFLTRPGFHEFYIEYVGGVAHLCSHAWPDIRWTATDLYFNRCALNEVFCLREKIKRQEEQIVGQTAENTRLRQMLKTEGVTTELQAMYDHIGQMMQRMQTADVMPFQIQQEPIPVTNQSHKAA